MKSLIPLIICLQLQGHVSNDIPLCKLTAKPDKRGKLLTGKVNKAFVRGYIGILFNPQTGEILYQYPEADTRKYGIEVGDFILKVEKENFLPCLMPNVVLLPAGYIINLTVRSKSGTVRTVPVKLIDARRFVNGS